jgi:hypothetical protein
LKFKNLRNLLTRITDVLSSIIELSEEVAGSVLSILFSAEAIDKAVQLEKPIFSSIFED